MAEENIEQELSRGRETLEVNRSREQRTVNVVWGGYLWALVR